MVQNKHLVFVYGSLKSGFRNHGCIEGINTSLLAEAKTEEDCFMMFSYGAYPAVARYKAGLAIGGELYEVDDEVLARLDQLESNGRFYKRELVNVVIDDDNLDNPVVQAWMYLLLYQPPRSWEGVDQTEDDVLIWIGGRKP